MKRAQEKGRIRQLWTWLFAKGGHLKDRVLRGGIWLAVGAGITRSANSIKLVILSRLLTPHDFGLMGIANTILKGFDYFSNVGLNGSLIKQRGDIRPYLDTAWTLQVLRCSAVAVSLFCGAPIGAQFFNSPEAVPIIRAIALVAFIRGFTSPAIVEVRKELNFQKQFLWRISGVVVGLVVAVTLGVLYRNVWALVNSVIVTQLTWTLLSFWIEPYRPHLRIDWVRARELMKFGKWLFWLTTVNYLSLYIDSLVVGKVFGVTSLGFYNMAHLAMLPTIQVGGILRGIMFPAFSKLQQERDLRRAFLQTLSFTSSIVIPLGCFLTVFAEPIILIGLGEQWRSVVPVFRILTWAGVASALIEVTNPMLLATNRPDVSVWTAVVKVIGLIGLLYLWTEPFGLSGVAAAVATAAVIALGIQLGFVLRLLRPKMIAVLKAPQVGCLGSLPLLGAGFLLSSSRPFPAVIVATSAMVISAIILLSGLRAQLRGNVVR